MSRLTPLFILALTLIPHYVFGFCVSNKMTDTTEFYVRQTSGFKDHTRYLSRFRFKHVLPDQMRCCSHTEPSCVGNLDPNTIVKFYVHRFRQGSDLGAIEIDCPAGGNLVVGGTAPFVSYTTTFIDGRDYQHTITNNPPRQSHRYFVDMNKTRTIDEE